MINLDNLSDSQREEIIGLQTQLDNSSSFLESIELEDQLTDLYIKYKLINSSATNFGDQIDCIGCGS